MSRQPGFFDVDERLKRLSDLGDQLEAFAAAVDFELFRPALDTALAYADRSKGGRPPLDAVMMFKILVIQAANNLARDELSACCATCTHNLVIGRMFQQPNLCSPD